MTAGGVGEQKLLDSFLFLKMGNSLQSLQVSMWLFPRPNSATISADKMNVVYRGL
jgi:hypothetical protein